MASETYALGEFSDLIRTIYQGPLESPPWKTFLGELKRILGLNYAVIIFRAASTELPMSLVLVGNGSSETTDSYSARYFELDPFIDLPLGKVVVATELIGEQRWRDSVFYQEYLQPVDVFHVMGADLKTEAGRECRLRLTRSTQAPAFSARDKSRLEVCLPHLTLALHLHSKLDHLDTERVLLASTIERMQLGTITLGQHGEIVTVNAEARKILDECDGIRIVGGALRVDIGADHQRLYQLINTVITQSLRRLPRIKVADAISIVRPSGRAKLTALVAAVEPTEWEDDRGRPVAVIYLRNPEQKPQGSITILRRLFELTHAEASLAVLLANGMTLDEAAEQHNIRRNTARAHLRAIFSKMGVTRQTELVRQVLNSVAQLG